MHKERSDKSFIKKPFYPGGNKAYSKFIYENLKYPAEAQKQKIEGIVNLKYQIDYNGNVTKVQVVSGIGHGCDEEAIRVIKLLKFQVPDIPRKLRVTFNKTAKIQFKIKAQKAKKQPAQMSYTLVIKPTSKVSSKPAKKKPRTYSYSIKI